MAKLELTDVERKELARRGFANPVYFCEFYLEHWFPTPIPWVHRGMLALLCRKCDFLQDDPELDLIIEYFYYLEDPDDEKSEKHYVFEKDEDGVLHMYLGRYTLVKMPRGFSKTTLVNAANIYGVVYREFKHLLYVSEAHDHACVQLGSVRGELESNSRILAVFGSLKPEDREGRVWSADRIETVDKCVITARGRGGQVRGLNWKGQRPDRINVDDVEDKESVSTDEQRLKVRNWAYGDLMPAMSELDPHASLVATGTLLHKEALLQTWERDPEFTAVSFGAMLPTGRFIWPLMMDEEKMERKKAQFASAGELSTFYLEYFNELRAGEDRNFQQGYFNYGHFKPSQFIAKAIALDPAISKNSASDYRAIVVVGLLENGTVVVLDVWYSQRATARQQVDAYFERVLRWGMAAPTRDFRAFFGVEMQSFQAALDETFKEEMFRRGTYFQITPIRHAKKKEERIEGTLQPKFASGHIWFSRRFPKLETQLLDYPNGKKDLPDALEMAVDLMSPLSPTSAPDSVDLAADEYEPLGEEEMGWNEYEVGNSFGDGGDAWSMTKPGARHTSANKALWN